MQILAVPLVAFACLACSVLAGTAGWAHDAWRPRLLAAAGTLRLLAGALVALAIAALGVVTFNTRAEFHQAEAQMRLFVGDVGRLDQALRQTGTAGEPARMLLFRFAEGMSRQLYDARATPELPDPEPLDAVRDALHQEVTRLSSVPDAAALAAGRFETLARTASSLLGTVPPLGVKLCRPLIVGWLMAGMGLFALLAGPQTRTAIGLVALAGLLALGVFYLEEIASPFSGGSWSRRRCWTTCCTRSANRPPAPSCLPAGLPRQCADRTGDG
jgi:hypothetical protein